MQLGGAIRYYATFAWMQEAEDSWQFDIFGFAQETPGHTLSLLALYLHKQTGFIADFRLNEGNLCNYMQKIESGYLAENPYHNRWLLQVCCFICAVVHALQPCHMSSCSTPIVLKCALLHAVRCLISTWKCCP